MSGANIQTCFPVYSFLLDKALKLDKDQKYSHILYYVHRKQSIQEWTK